jgi:hypothetical protein
MQETALFGAPLSYRVTGEPRAQAFAVAGAYVLLLP